MSGILIGIAYGLHWANRNYLILSSTNNDNRNYYTGTEYTLVNIAFLVAPILSGSFINYGVKLGYFSKDTGYLLIIGFIFIICSFAALAILTGDYKTPAT